MGKHCHGQLVKCGFELVQGWECFHRHIKKKLFHNTFPAYGFLIIGFHKFMSRNSFPFMFPWTASMCQGLVVKHDKKRFQKNMFVKSDKLFQTIFYSPVLPSVRPTVRPSDRPTIRPTVRTSFRASERPIVRPCDRRTVPLSDRPTIRPWYHML